MLVTLSLLLTLLPQQEPSTELQNALTMDSSATRYRAAVEVARGGSELEEWLLDEVGDGTGERQRALLLSCALMGTPRTLAELEVAARRGSRPKPDPERAYALLLYGSFHPDAGANPKEDWGRARSDYERACLMVGLLGRRGALSAEDWRKLCKKSKVPELEAIRTMGVMLAGEQPAEVDPKSADDVLLAAMLLASVLEGAPPVSAELIDVSANSLPELWIAAARRESARDLAALKTMPAASTGAAAGPALRELDADHQQAAFDHFHVRIRDSDARAWLFGAAGDLGLDFPAPLDPEKLDTGEVAGILRLARHAPARAAVAARQRLPAARRSLARSGSNPDRWAAGVVIGVAYADSAASPSGSAREADLAILLEWVEAASGEEKLRLWPVWNLARGALDDLETRNHWYRSWSRELGAGTAGFLDIEGPRWASYLLVGGTQAADERLHLVDRFPGLELEARDYSADHNVYRDIADFLRGSYRFGIPD